MDLEARSLQPGVKAMLLAKLREYKSDLTKLKREVKKIASAKSSQTAHDELLDSGMANAHMVNLHFCYFFLKPFFIPSACKMGQVNGSKQVALGNICPFLSMVNPLNTYQQKLFYYNNNLMF